jgi:hypothetical protein
MSSSTRAPTLPYGRPTHAVIESSGPSRTHCRKRRVRGPVCARRGGQHVLFVTVLDVEQWRDHRGFERPDDGRPDHQRDDWTDHGRDDSHDQHGREPSIQLWVLDVHSASGLLSIECPHDVLESADLPESGRDVRVRRPRELQPGQGLLLHARHRRPLPPGLPRYDPLQDLGDVHGRPDVPAVRSVSGRLRLHLSRSGWRLRRQCVRAPPLLLGYRAKACACP